MAVQGHPGGPAGHRADEEWLKRIKQIARSKFADSPYNSEAAPGDRGALSSPLIKVTESQI